MIKVVQDEKHVLSHGKVHRPLSCLFIVIVIELMDALITVNMPSKPPTTYSCRWLASGPFIWEASKRILCQVNLYIALVSTLYENIQKML